jgi:hypothetical protein
LYRILTIALMVFALALPSARAQVSQTPQVSQTHCRSAALKFGAVGSELIERFDDGHGHDVELWCVRTVFTAHFDLRIGWDEQTPSGLIHRSATIAGCFFNHGRNSGPDLVRDNQGAWSKVEWTNIGPPDDNATYRFSYDYHSGMVTVTAATACHGPVTRLLEPQANFERLNDLLPDPPEGACGGRPAMDSAPTSG